MSNAYFNNSFGNSNNEMADHISWQNDNQQQQQQYMSRMEQPSQVDEGRFYSNNVSDGSIGMNIMGMNHQQMNMGGSEFSTTTDKRGGDSNGDDSFASHFPGPPIQTSKACQQGPDGCNLFIFHIPNDLTNMDLFNLFTPFGSVISARIMVENESGRSRGFGFVSFDHPSAANAAIRSMNGFQIGHKRLKVAHKKEMPGERNMFDDNFMPGRGMSPNGMPSNTHNGFMRQGHNMMPSSSYQDMQFQQQQRFQPRPPQGPAPGMGGLDASMANLSLQSGGGGMYGAGGGVGYGKPPLPPSHGYSNVYGNSHFNSQSPYLGQTSPQQLQRQQEQLYQQQLQLQHQQQQRSHDPTLNRVGSASSTTSNLSAGSLDDELVRDVKDEGNLFSHGSGLDLLNNVRSDLNSQASSSPLESDLVWGSAPVSSNLESQLSDSSFSRTSSARSFSPSRGDSLRSLISKKSSSLSNRSDSPSSSRGSVSPIGTQSPNRQFSRSPVSVLTKTSSQDSKGIDSPVLSAELLAQGQNMLGDSAEIKSQNVKVTANSSALTSALALAELNATSPSVTPRVSLTSLSPEDMPELMAEQAAAALSMPTASATAPAPMTTEQILMMQEQLKQQQALIAGQNELLKALLAQQQALPSSSPTPQHALQTTDKSQAPSHTP